MPLLTSAFALAEKLGGKPRVLFTIAIGARMWRHAGSVKDVTVTATGLTYKAAKIQVDSDIERRDETGPQRITVKMGIRLPVVAALRGAGTTEPMYMGIHRYHPSVGGTPARWAFGEIKSVGVKRGWCVVEFETDEAAWEDDVPRAIFAPHCQKDTYSPECGVNMDDFAVDAAVTDVDGLSITVDSVSGKADGYFGNGGLLKLGNNFYHVLTQVGTTLTLFRPPPRGLSLPAAVTLYPGDDLTHETCRDKFDNLDNFLGFKWLPSSDPTTDLEIRGPDVLFAPHEPPDPPAYTTPAKYAWLRALAASLTLDGSGNVSTWDDSSGNGHDATQGDAAKRPGALSLGPDPITGTERAVVGFGPSSLDNPYGHVGAGGSETALAIDLSGLGSTAELFVAFSSAEDPVTIARALLELHASGRGNNALILKPDGSISDGTGIDAEIQFTYRPGISLKGGRHVLNHSITSTRWSVRLDGQLLWTALATDLPGFAVGWNNPGVLGAGNNGASWIGPWYGLLAYENILNGADRATSLAYMQTGLGSPA